MHQSLHTGFARVSGKPRGSLDMHRVKAVPAVLDVEADRIHDTVGADESRSHRCLIMQIRSHGLRNRFIRPKYRLDPLRMAGGHPHPKPAPKEMPNDPPAEEAGPAEHGNQSPTLRCAPFQACGRNRHLASATNVLAVVISGRVVSAAPTISSKRP